MTSLDKEVLTKVQKELKEIKKLLERLMKPI